MRQRGRASLISAFASALIAYGIWLWASAPPDGWPAAAAMERTRLERLPARDIMQMKLAHATARAPLAVGLFGNSRAVQVSAGHLGLSRERFFNFAVPGTSLRNSVAMLERLAAGGHMPAIALVSLDHLYLQYYANPEITDPLSWWRLVKGDWSAASRAGLGARSRARLLWRHLWSAWVTFESSLQFSLMVERHGAGAQAHSGHYQQDGSRPLPAGTPSIEPLPQPPRAIDAAVLAMDMQRLGRLAASGVQLMVYESPIHPAGLAADQAASQGGADTAQLRQQWLNACEQAKLTCVPAPRALPPGSEPWLDASHAPAGALAAWLRGQVDLEAP